VDISETALALAAKNLNHNVNLSHLSKRALDEVRFIKGDIFSGSRKNYTGRISAGKTTSNINDDRPSIPASNPYLLPENTFLQLSSTWDILISNPPYISPLAYGNGITKRSVRLYEPKLALVPPSPEVCTDSPNLPVADAGDSFYPILLDLSVRVGADLTVLECGDAEQADRVLSLAREREDVRTGVKAGVWKCDDYADIREAYCDEELLLNDRRAENDGAMAVAIIRD
jgi:hypothetical protein